MKHLPTAYDLSVQEVVLLKQLEEMDIVGESADAYYEVSGKRRVRVRMDFVDDRGEPIKK